MTPTSPNRAGIPLDGVLNCTQPSGGELVASSCTADSRHVRQGDVFFAVEGADADGHEFAREAVERGASVVVAERYLPGLTVPCLVVSDTRVAFGECCHALMGQPSREMNVIGVTGTQGKSSTVVLLAAILREAGVPTGTLSTFGFDDSLVRQNPVETTPPILAKWLANMSAAGCSHAVVEISSAALSRHRTAGIELDMACVTNVTRNHIDLHNSVANYRSAKRRIFDYLTGDGIAVLNADDPVTASMVSDVDGPAITFGLDRPAEVSARVLERNISEQTFLLQLGHQSAMIRTRLIGDHHISNCLAAAAAASAQGVDLLTIAKGLESVDQLAGRMERIECGQPFATFVDDAHTPDAIAACLSAAKSVTPGRLICVFGAPGHRERQLRLPLGAAVSRLADVAVITAADPHDEDPARIASDLAASFGDDQLPHVVHDRCQAIAWAVEQAEAGDTIVVAGRGTVKQQTVGCHRYEMDDREFVRELLYRNNSSDLPNRAAA